MFGTLQFITADEMKVERICTRVASGIEKQLKCNKTVYLIGERVRELNTLER